MLCNISQALEVLFFLSIKDNVRLILQEVGASELACNLMKEWPEKEGIVKAAISLVSNMSYYSQDSQFAVGNAGGCEAIVAGMRKFPKNHYIQMYACLAIRNLAMENERNQQRFQEAHARTAISSAMWTHGGSAKADSVKVVPYWAKRALDVVPKQSSGVPMMALVVSDVMARFKELKSQALADELAGVDHSKCLL